VREATNALKVRPNWRPAIVTSVCGYQAIGDRHATRECVERLARCEASADALAPLWGANPRWREEWNGLLQQAACERP
jgi:hypothetical protein